MCPLDRVLTDKNLIYLLNLQFYCVNISYPMDNRPIQQAGHVTYSWQSQSRQAASPSLSKHLIFRLICELLVWVLHHFKIT